MERSSSAETCVLCSLALGKICVEAVKSGRKSALFGSSSVSNRSLEFFAEAPDLVVRQRAHPETSLRDSFDGLECVEGACL